MITMKDILTESGTPRPDYKAMSDNELEMGISIMQNELRNRKERKRTEAWKKVVTAMQEFIEDFGNIQVYDSSGSVTHISWTDAQTMDIGEILID